MPTQNHHVHIEVQKAPEWELAAPATSGVHQAHLPAGPGHHGESRKVVGGWDEVAVVHQVSKPAIIVFPKPACS